MNEFVLALIQALFPWITIWVLAKYFHYQARRDADREGRLLQTNDDLTSQIIAFKNPWAAQVFAQTQSLRGVPKPDKDDEQMQRDLEGRMVEVDEADLA